MTDAELYANLFREATDGRKPYPYQIDFACRAELCDLLQIPTGLGKTSTIVLGWLFRRRFAQDWIMRSSTPRRLVICLPMRTLVDQTFENSQSWLDRLGLLANGNSISVPPNGWAAKHADAGKTRIAVHRLMGGAEASRWDEFPENDAILIGTQDMLISRALNRGFGMSRYRWPAHFALLNNDCLWVMDETQLMGVGVTTSAQLQGLREKLATFGTTRSVWMSATLQTDTIETIDHPCPEDGWKTLSLGPEDRDQPAVQKLLIAGKPVQSAETTLTFSNEKKDYPAELANEIVNAHRPGSLTLAVTNRVERAQGLFSALKKLLKAQEAAPQLFLIHSRFRPHERQNCQKEALDESSIAPNRAGRIIVATQAIEAGVDVSATTLFTELAPWPSLVQRFGRCNRRGTCGENATPPAAVYWIDVDTSDDKRTKSLALPYTPDMLDASREHLQKLSDVGPASLAKVSHDEPEALVHVLRRKDLLELFDTTPDLAGNDLDVSRYIRDTEDTDVQVYWRDWKLDPNGRRMTPPEYKDASGNIQFPAPTRDELCAVSCVQVRNFVESLKKAKKPWLTWRWNPLDRAWESLAPADVRPGMVVLLHVDAGGYDEALGWTGDPKHRPPQMPAPEEIQELEAMEEEDLGNEAVTLTQHLRDVGSEAANLKTALSMEGDAIPWEAIIRSAFWHDVGKAHPAFQQALRTSCPDLSTQQLWAKSGRSGRLNYQMPEPDGSNRRGFRHELASALAWLAQNDESPQADLIAYLIAAHHGKVRSSIRSMPIETPPEDSNRHFARGLWDGDELPAVEINENESSPEFEVDLSLMKLGETIDPITGKVRPSWLSRTLRLRDEFGPFKLSFVETLVRVADWRGSQKGPA